MRVVLDTNVIVSATLSPTGAPAQVLDQWRQNVFELLISESILVEYQRALSYEQKRARHGLSTEDIVRIGEDFREFALVVDALPELAVIAEDPDDDTFLACAEAGGAAYIVSGDAHLLKLEEYEGIQILSPAAFIAFLKAAEPERDAES